MKISARSHKLIWGLFLFNGLMALIGISTFHIMFTGNPTSLQVNYQDVVELYDTMIALEFVLLSFLIPAETAGAISGERERQTLDILLTTPLRTWEIVVGKLVASISTVLLYMFSGLPILSLAFLIGGVDLRDVLIFALYGCVYAIYIGSFGIFYSAFFKKTITSIITTYGTLLGLSFLSMFMEFVYYVIQYNKVHPLQSGKVVGFGLFSPFLSVISLESGQMGGSSSYEKWCLLGINRDSFWIQHVSAMEWFWISVVVQLILALILLCLAVKVINPRNRKSL